MFAIACLMSYQSNAQLFSISDLSNKKEVPPPETAPPVVDTTSTTQGTTTTGTSNTTGQGSFEGNLIGMFLANLAGEKSSKAISPSLALSGGWKINEWAGFEFRFSALQSPDDTIQTINAGSLMKPEASNYNINLNADFRPFKSANGLSLNFNTNISGQELSLSDETSKEYMTGAVTSYLGRYSLAYMFGPDDGLGLYASVLHYSLWNGNQFFEERFGDKAAKSFANLEVALRIPIKIGDDKDTYINLHVMKNSKDFKELLGNNDKATVIIRVGRMAQFTK